MNQLVLTKFTNKDVLVVVEVRDYHLEQSCDI